MRSKPTGQDTDRDRDTVAGGAFEFIWCARLRDVEYATMSKDVCISHVCHHAACAWVVVLPLCICIDVHLYITSLFVLPFPRLRGTGQVSCHSGMWGSVGLGCGGQRGICAHRPQAGPRWSPAKLEWWPPWSSWLSLLLAAFAALQLILLCWWRSSEHLAKCASDCCEWFDLVMRPIWLPHWLAGVLENL